MPEEPTAKTPRAVDLSKHAQRWHTCPLMHTVNGSTSSWPWAHTGFGSGTSPARHLESRSQRYMPNLPADLADASPSNAPMPPRSYQLLLLLLLLVPELASGETVVAGGEESAACAAANRTDAATLRADRLTVILTGYSERRLPLLRAIAGAYAAHPLVLAVVVLWCNPSTPDRLLLRRRGGIGFPPGVAVRRAASASLNSRFLPRPSDIRTAAVAVADDDVLPDAAALSFAFATWQQQQQHQRPAPAPAPLVGFFPRSHHLDLARGRWAYTAAQPGRYSMVLTKLMLLGTDLLRTYSCSPELAAARAVVDRERNCEDILMNFVAAEASGAGPVLVEAGGVRDWGDPRNDAGASAGEGTGGGVRDVGLSATGGVGHWEKRGRCITEFHRLLGRMPLRYSYGKVVQATAGEQGLCSKGGRLVRCDH